MWRSLFIIALTGKVLKRSETLDRHSAVTKAGLFLIPEPRSGSHAVIQSIVMGQLSVVKALLLWSAPPCQRGDSQEPPRHVFTDTPDSFSAMTEEYACNLPSLF